MSEGTRRIAAPGLAILAALALLGAVVAGYANDALFDSDEFAERATAALDDEAVQRRDREPGHRRPRAQRRAGPDRRPAADRGRRRRDRRRRRLPGPLPQRDPRRPPLDLRAGREHGHADARRRRRGAPRRDSRRCARSSPKQIPGGVDIEIAEINPPAWLADVAQLADDVEALELDPAGAGAGPRRRRAAGLPRPAADGDAARGRGGDLRGRRGGRARAPRSAILLTRIDEPGARDAVDGDLARVPRRPDHDPVPVRRAAGR